MTHDVCVVGLGGIGSAILAHCAARGARVIGLEQFPRGHDLGASSGKSRMIRKAYFEDPAYVPLILRAYELWSELERNAHQELLRTTGVLAVGRETSDIINGIRRAAREHQLPIELFDHGELHRRYPMLELQADEIGVFEPEAGVLTPERAIAAHLAMAERDGASTRFAVSMTDWKARDDAGFDIQLADESRLCARVLILALGPWVQRTLAGLGIAIRIQRNVQAWFAPGTSCYAAPKFPAFLLDRAGLPAPLYGFPDLGDGVKAAFHGAGDITDPHHLQREIDEPRDVAPLTRAMNGWMPGAAANFLSAKACMYSLTPDEHFVVDRHPRMSTLSFAAASPATASSSRP